MNNAKLGLFLMLATAIATTSMSAPAQAQLGRFNGSNSRDRMQQFLDRFHNDADTFRRDFDKALDNNSRFNNSNGRFNNTYNRKDELKQLAKDFDDSVGRLRRDFKNGSSTDSNVQTVLDQGSRLNTVMQRINLGGNTQQDWTTVSSELNTLSRFSNVQRRF